MISYQFGDRQFNFRVAAILLDRGRLLVHQELGEEFWTVPGGRCELLEPTTETLVREMHEELGSPAEVSRLLWIVENFFRREGREWHEIAFYYLVNLPEESSLRSHPGKFSGVEEGTVLTFQWVPLEDLGSLRLYPSFLADKLNAPLPETLQHIVWHDPEERVVRRPRGNP
jgi:ADP-ribose pyrophosphatase YjhB (NUDIX family)